MEEARITREKEKNFFVGVAIGGTALLCQALVLPSVGKGPLPIGDVNVFNAPITIGAIAALRYLTRQGAGGCLPIAERKKSGIWLPFRRTKELFRRSEGFALGLLTGSLTAGIYFGVCQIPYGGLVLKSALALVPLCSVLRSALLRLEGKKAGLSGQEAPLREACVRVKPQGSSIDHAI